MRQTYHDNNVQLEKDLEISFNGCNFRREEIQIFLTNINFRNDEFWIWPFKLLEIS